jgi:hypothetical protein
MNIEQRKEKKREEKSEERRTKEKTGIEVWPKRGKNRKESWSKVSESSQDQAVVLIRSGVQEVRKDLVSHPRTTTTTTSRKHCSLPSS